MKLLLKYLSAFVLLSIVALYTSCTNPTDDGDYVEPISLYEKISGDWAITGVSQIDETAKASGIDPNEISLLDQFDFAGFGLSLETDADGAPSTYSVSGSAPELFASSGYWDLNSTFPLAGGSAPVIFLYSDASLSNLTGKLTVMAVPGTNPTMDLSLTRTVNGVPFVTYLYKLTTAATIDVK